MGHSQYVGSCFPSGKCVAIDKTGYFQGYSVTTSISSKTKNKYYDPTLNLIVDGIPSYNASTGDIISYSGGTTCSIVIKWLETCTQIKQSGSCTKFESSAQTYIDTHYIAPLTPYHVYFSSNLKERYDTFQSG